MWSVFKKVNTDLSVLYSALRVKINIFGSDDGNWFEEPYMSHFYV